MIAFFTFHIKIKLKSFNIFNPFYGAFRVDFCSPWLDFDLPLRLSVTVEEDGTQFYAISQMVLIIFNGCNLLNAVLKAFIFIIIDATFFILCLQSLCCLCRLFPQCRSAMRIRLGLALYNKTLSFQEKKSFFFY